jgi:hypothetical protein
MPVRRHREGVLVKALLSLMLTFMCCGLGCGGYETDCDPVDPQSGLPVVINFNPGIPPFVFHEPIIGGNLHFGGPVSGSNPGGVHSTASDGGLTEDQDVGPSHTTTETPL